MPPSGTTTGTEPDRPAPLRLRGPARCKLARGPRRPGKAQPPPGEITAQPNISLLALRLAGLQLLC
ncbi:hypothetical protein EXU10_01095 [Klebsiella quasipneumoniae subsp. similipneumoniae]|nr:hypothetical protein [Klebsiella quasipneumoniae]TBO72419.1 hypothetical protein EXT85_20310 [Klebsiella quasipneumoniae subsp. similipneumoniae]TBO86923.1 hypothetical protein EXT88_11455 [Klebsiella quasipneumoniae subsp. similipneumoniae]TBO93901.1 hypothetical protein EXU03_06840 [Klebsiella quasipneumoniae subsp. similipneumoniae]TBO98781.1 hypothetical protein EXU08_09590 [Klebsiella quasipneumoniae subsp. similipneumoniae]